jgi:hypothetical protein
MTPRFIILVETITGDVLEAFTWTRDAQSGIDRARREAVEFKQVPVRVWAEPVAS